MWVYADDTPVRANSPDICSTKIDSPQGLCHDSHVYDIQLARGAEQDLKKLSAFHRNTIIDAMERNLAHEPTRISRNRKVLVGLIPPWTAEPPVWELRVGNYRVFYDVAEEERVVYIRAIRKKPAERTTTDLL